MNTAIHSETIGNLKLSIFQDYDVENPRHDFDHFGTLVCFHRNYDLSDKGMEKKFTPESLMEYIKKSGAIALPVYLMDHSGLRMSTGSFGCPWDSGQVGMIFVEKSKILKEYDVKRVTPALKAKVLACLKAEIKEMDQYLSGDVYGYVIEKPVKCECCGHVEMEHVDSCWGFFGHEYAITEAESAFKASQEANK